MRLTLEEALEAKDREQAARDAGPILGPAEWGLEGVGLLRVPDLGKTRNSCHRLGLQSCMAGCDNPRLEAAAFARAAMTATFRAFRLEFRKALDGIR